MKVKVCSFLIALVLIVLAAVPALAAESSLVESKNVLQEHEDNYYCAENTIYGEEVIEKLSSNRARNYFQKIQADYSYIPYAASTKEVYVAETVCKDGTVSDSHIMTSEEVLQYKLDIALSMNDQDAETKGKTLVGDDSNFPEVKKITLYLVVYKDSNRNYYAYGTADWYDDSGSGKYTPSAGDDFIAITWGGNGELMRSTSSVSGQYTDGDAIGFDKEKSDTYKGYCWSFSEQKKFLFFQTAYANYVDVYVKLKKANSTVKGKHTNVKMTYIHTYQSVTGGISFEVGTDGAAAGINLSQCEKKWNLEVDVPYIRY